MRTVLITGATGGLGPPIVSALLEAREVGRVVALVRPHFAGVDARCAHLRAAVEQTDDSLPERRHPRRSRLIPVAGDVRRPDLGLNEAATSELQRSVEIVIHAAADTRFRCSRAEQHLTNVDGTRHLLRWAAKCSALRRLVLVSTSCVAGHQIGEMAEIVEPDSPTFVNFYERSKWEAEQLAVDSGLPVAIVRLATCAGSVATGQVHRLGGLHYALRWMLQGLVPMVPGAPDCRVDLIPSELAAQLITRAAIQGAATNPFVCHASAGRSAPRLDELIDFLAATFRQMSVPWQRGQITPPSIVSASTFAAFRQTVAASGDLLFQQVIESLDGFLPALLYPKFYRTDNACWLWNGPLPTVDWRRLIHLVVDDCMKNDWARTKEAAVKHA